LFFPAEFSIEARNRVEAIEIKTRRATTRGLAKYSSDQSAQVLEPSLVKYFVTVTCAFGHEACLVAMHSAPGVTPWGADRVRSEVRDFLKSLLLEALTRWDFQMVRSMISNGQVAPIALLRFEATPEWRKYERELVSLSSVQSRAVNSPTLSLADRLDTCKARRDMTDEQVWHAIGLGKTTYYAVRNGLGNRVNKIKVSDWLKENGF
jgi:hypothetical protein